MSSDDIVFEGEVSYREPAKLRRPDRDRRYACIAYEVPGPGDLPIFLDRKPADAIERHALRDTSVELGGILLGKECIDDETGEPFVWVTESIEAKHYENTQASFTYTHESWEEITRERDRLHPDLDIVGWYHTHPDFGIFLSSMDLFIQHNFFAQPLQVAYVVDPVRQDRGFFQWREGQMAQVGGYHLAARRDERIALSRLVNDLENIPNAEGGGGGLSPRLEAELIAMLSRPQQPMAAPQAQAAAIYSLLGVLVGALGVAVWLLLQNLNASLQAQKDEVKHLADNLVRARERDEAAIDAEGVKAKEEALNALLRDVRPAELEESVMTAYVRTRQERDLAVSKLAKAEAVADKVAASLVALNGENKALKIDNEDLQKKYNDLTADSRRQIAGYKEDLGKLKDELKEKDSLLEDKGVGFLTRKYQYSWYAAVVGWVLTLLLGLGLLVVTGRNLPVEEATAPAEPEPPHTIT